MAQFQEVAHLSNRWNSPLHLVDLVDLIEAHLFAIVNRWLLLSDHSLFGSLAVQVIEQWLSFCSKQIVEQPPLGGL